MDDTTVSGKLNQANVRAMILDLRGYLADCRSRSTAMADSDEKHKHSKAYGMLDGGVEYAIVHLGALLNHMEV